MFFEDKAQALRDDARVAAARRMAVCDAVENSPGYRSFANLLDRLFGQEVGDAFRAPFALGDGPAARPCGEAGIADADVRRYDAPVTFRSIDALVSAERACVVDSRRVLDDDQFARLLINRVKRPTFETGSCTVRYAGADRAGTEE